LLLIVIGGPDGTDSKIHKGFFSPLRGAQSSCASKLIRRLSLSNRVLSLSPSRAIKKATSFNVTAMIYYLKTRDRENWGENQPEPLKEIHPHDYKNVGFLMTI
jgi:hypothetical protein